MNHRMLASCAALALAQGALAQVVNISQNRTVGARGAFSSWLSDSTTGLGDWNRTVVQTDGGFNSGGIGSQLTSVGPTRIYGSGSAYANDDIQTTSGRAYSTVDVVFEVTAPTNYTFAGTWSTTWDWYAMNPTCQMVLEQIAPISRTLHRSEFSADWIAGTATTSGTAALSGDLPVGQYRLVSSVAMLVAMNPGVYSGHAEFQFDLRVPAPGALCLLGIVPMAARRRR